MLGGALGTHRLHGHGVKGKHRLRPRGPLEYRGGHRLSGPVVFPDTDSTMGNCGALSYLMDITYNLQSGSWIRNCAEYGWSVPRPRRTVKLA